MVELIASLLALRAGRLFPMFNYDMPDAECPIHAVRDIPRRPASGSST